MYMYMYICTMHVSFFCSLISLPRSSLFSYMYMYILFLFPLLLVTCTCIFLFILSPLSLSLPPRYWSHPMILGLDYTIYKIILFPVNTKDVSIPVAKLRQHSGWEDVHVHIHVHVHNKMNDHNNLLYMYMYMYCTCICSYTKLFSFFFLLPSLSLFLSLSSVVMANVSYVAQKTTIYMFGRHSTIMQNYRQSEKTETTTLNALQVNQYNNSELYNYKLELYYNYYSFIFLF